MVLQTCWRRGVIVVVVASEHLGWAVTNSLMEGRRVKPFGEASRSGRTGGQVRNEASTAALVLACVPEMGIGSTQLME